MLSDLRLKLVSFFFFSFVHFMWSAMSHLLLELLTFILTTNLYNRRYSDTTLCHIQAASEGRKSSGMGFSNSNSNICSSSSLLCLLNKFKATQQPCIKSCLQKMNNVQRFSFPTYNLRKLLNSGGVSGLQPRLNSNGMCRRIETLLQQCNIWSNNLVRHNANRN